MSSCSIGIDIGGTFTDVVLVDESTGRFHRVKVPSTPYDQSIGSVDGIARVLEVAGFAPADIRSFRHGTTVATNAVLEGRLAPCALITTAGFRDVLEIARQRRPNAYDFQAEKPKPIVPRRLRFEVRERLDHAGRVVEPLVEADVRAVAEQVRSANVRSVAVCLLFAFLNPAHEQRVAQLLGDLLPGLPVFLSSEVLPEYREYERTSTVALSASIAPVVSAYADRLAGAVHQAGVSCELHLMKSTGGLMTFRAVERRAVETVLSGPAAGAIAVGHLGGLIDQPRLIGFDMGGTSTDVSLVIDGRPRVTTEGKIGDHPLRLPVIDIRTIGAGGGSIAWLDAADGLHVGPQSAGADPGPACFGRQDGYPTVTDANLCLGRLNASYFLGGELDLDVEASRRAIARQIGRAFGEDITRAALGIVDIVNSNMARAIREISVANGYDAREFALVTFGGAGALHACSLAEELEVPLVIVPEDAGLLSARGLLVADILSELSVTRLSRVAETSVADLEAGFQQLERRARQELAADGIDTASCRFERLLDMRYVGQAYEITLSQPAAPPASLLNEWDAAFHRMHEQLYWWNDRQRPTEIVTLRVYATVPVVKAPAEHEGPAGVDASPAFKSTRPVVFSGVEPIAAATYERSALRAGNVVSGPAVIESFDTTILVSPRHEAAMDSLRNILIRPRRD